MVGGAGGIGQPLSMLMAMDPNAGCRAWADSLLYVIVVIVTKVQEVHAVAETSRSRQNCLVDSCQA